MIGWSSLALWYRRCRHSGIRYDASDSPMCRSVRVKEFSLPSRSGSPRKSIRFQRWKRSVEPGERDEANSGAFATDPIVNVGAVRGKIQKAQRVKRCVDRSISQPDRKRRHGMPTSVLFPSARQASVSKHAVLPAQKWTAKSPTALMRGAEGKLASRIVPGEADFTVSRPPSSPKRSRMPLKPTP